MEDWLPIWRQIITRAELELPEIRASFVEFFMFLPQAGIINTATKAKSEESFVNNKEFQECLTEVDRTLERLQTVSRSLTSNMALLDSRRSIAEAQNVTRLAELAFLFIPLTFAATLLGMQISLRTGCLYPHSSFWVYYSLDSPTV
jgi:Mg2+ and Co2+ transporter CorA